MCSGCQFRNMMFNASHGSVDHAKAMEEKRIPGVKLKTLRL